MRTRVHQQVSQKRVAELAGVSQPMVSRVLSGRAVISDGTRKRILEAAESIGYRPNLLVRGMQTGKTRVIGVMTPPFDSFWSDVLYGIHDTLSEQDHVPMTLWTSHEGRHKPVTPGSPERDLKQIHQLLDRRIDGVILWPPFAALYRNHIHEFSSRDLPIVTIDYQLPPEFHADCVSSDEKAGGAAIVKHLYDLGHRRIGHLAGILHSSWAIQRCEAFEAAIGTYPGATSIVLEVTPGPMATAGLEQARAMLAGSNRPTAVCAATDFLARQVYAAAAELKLRIPEDLSVVGFADDDFTAAMQPPLTTVRQHGYEIGCRAAEIVVGRSSDGEVNRASKNVQVPVELVVRESTGAAPVRHNNN